MAAVDLLRVARDQYTYRQLSELTGLPITVLNRYVKGHVLPNSIRARRLWEDLTKMLSLESEVRRRVRLDDEGYFDNTRIIGDVNLLRRAANYALLKFAGRRVTKVLTATVDGVPLATMIADSLGVNLAIAKNRKDVGVQSFLEETYVLGDSGVIATLFVPRDVIKRRDSVLVVDDVMKSSNAQAVLINLARKAGADLTGIFVLVAIGGEWRKKIEAPQIEVILKLNSSTISPSSSMKAALHFLLLTSTPTYLILSFTSLHFIYAGFRLHALIRAQSPPF